MPKRLFHPAKGLPLLVFVVVLGCSQKTTRLDLYWPYDLWDGMNRMVFALDELGYEIYSVDSDNGTILARKWPTAEKRATLTGFDSRRPYELWIQFPYEARTPILIREVVSETGAAAFSEKNFQRIVNVIAKKFRQFGGVVVEVKAES